MRKIIVGVDGSASSLAALDWAASEAAQRDARLVVVHAWHVPASAYGSASAYGVLPAVYPEPGVYEGATREVLRTAIEQLDASAVTAGIEQRLVKGDPGSALVENAADAELIVLGASHRSGLGELLLGSTSRSVARHATVPIVVVPAPHVPAAVAA